MAPTRPYVELATLYTHQVLSGEIPACKWVRLACKRQLADLDRQADPKFPFRFDGKIAARACSFLEQLPHTQGPLAFQHDDDSWNTLQLQPWQCFVTCCVYGWIRKDSPAHRPIRRFTRVYEEEPRGNGKSLRLSGALLYSFAEKEQGVEAYSAAVDRDQAGKVYGEARAMLEKRKDLARALGLKLTSRNIYQQASNSRATALSRDAKKSGDGKNVAFASLDELHAHPTREVYDVIDTGTGKRGGNALIWAITTAGFDSSGIAYEKRDYICKILEGIITDDAWFGIIYTIDEGDKWEDPSVWRKANPNWGVSVDPVDFESKAKRAIAVLSERNGFLTKHLDIWCNADSAWMDLSAWDACADKTLKEETFAGATCVLGIDLASKVDLVAKAKLFARDLTLPDGKSERHYYCFVTCYLPEAAINASGNAQYKGWAMNGLIQSIPGNVIRDAPIVADVEADAAKHKVHEIAYDLWSAREFANTLSDKGFTMVEVRQNVQNLSEPMKQLQALILSGRFHHDGNPCLRWQMSNVIAHADHNDNVFPNKLKPENKIDAPVAIITALNRALLAPATPSESVYVARAQAGQPLLVTL